MFDRKYIVENVEAVKQNCANRNISVDVDRLVELELQRRGKLQLVQDLNTQSNAESKKIGQAKDSEERESLKVSARALREQKDAAQAETMGRLHKKMLRQINSRQGHSKNIPICEWESKPAEEKRW